MKLGARTRSPRKFRKNAASNGWIDWVTWRTPTCNHAEERAGEHHEADAPDRVRRGLTATRIASRAHLPDVPGKWSHRFLRDDAGRKLGAMPGHRAGGRSRGAGRGGGGRSRGMERTPCFRMAPKPEAGATLPPGPGPGPGPGAGTGRRAQAARPRLDPASADRRAIRSVRRAFSTTGWSMKHPSTWMEAVPLASACSNAAT